MCMPSIKLPHAKFNTNPHITELCVLVLQNNYDSDSKDKNTE